MRIGTHLFSTGGLGYHFRAAKYSDQLWDTFKTNLESWLMLWEKKNSTLLLIGPSAGYSLSEKFLSRYDKILMSEPDPLARVLFRRRFPNLEVETLRGDFITQDKGFPQCDILFCNLLGQLRLDQKSIRNLLLRLEGHNFATYHDLFSFWGSFHWLSEKIYAGSTINESHLFSLFIHSKKQSELTVEDHGLLNVFPVSTRVVLHWEIVPGRHHLIECVSSSSFSFDK